MGCEERNEIAADSWNGITAANPRLLAELTRYYKAVIQGTLRVLRVFFTGKGLLRPSPVSQLTK